MIVRTHGGDAELRGYQAAAMMPPGRGASSMNTDGPQDPAAAMAVPAAMRAARLIFESLAMMPVKVMRATGDSLADARDTWQWELLHTKPTAQQSAYAMREWAYGSMLNGNGYLEKLKVGQRVVELLPVDPSRVAPYLRGLELRYRVQRGSGQVEDMGADRLLHLPGLLLENPYVGVSPVAYHRATIGAAVARQRHEARLWTNGAKVSSVIAYAQRLEAEQRRELRESFDAGYVRGDGGTLVLDSGATFAPGSLSQSDAQFIESSRQGVEGVANIYGVPIGFLASGDKPGTATPEQDFQRLVSLTLDPWAARFEGALNADPDLFAGTGLVCKVVRNVLLRADVKTRFETYTSARQSGVLTVNEIRALEDYPPVDGGDVIQQTPVGGAPNTPTPGGPA